MTFWNVSRTGTYINVLSMHMDSYKTIENGIRFMPGLLITHYPIDCTFIFWPNAGCRNSAVNVHFAAAKKIKNYIMTTRNKNTHARPPFSETTIKMFTLPSRRFNSRHFTMLLPFMTVSYFLVCLVMLVQRAQVCWHKSYKVGRVQHYLFGQVWTESNQKLYRLRQYGIETNTTHTLTQQ